MSFAHSTDAARAETHERLPTGVPDIAFGTHVFGNGLRLVVHEDRSTPRVAMQVRYDVGAKDEPEGYTGFAHLFEHLMFKGSANRPGGWHQAVLPLGATNVNGTTDYDRTNFFQTVPKAVLDRVLWMEADRMGFVLEGIDAKSLADEIEVVKNEKRETSAGPGAVAGQYLQEALYPRSHPYGHPVIGDDADLDAATLERAAVWHRRWYGPSNAVIALAGDIDLAEAIAKVGHWFGDLPPGPPLKREYRHLPLSGGLRRMQCQVELPFRQLIGVWHCGGSQDADGPLLALAAAILGSGPRAWLRKRLVDQEQLCFDASVSHNPQLLCGLFQADLVLQPGADAARVEAAVAQEFERFRAEGPSMAELDEARRRMQRSYSNALEDIAFKADLLCRNMLTFGAPDGDRYLMEVAHQAAPDDIREAFARWCDPARQAIQFDVVPFPRGTATPAIDRSVAPEIGDIHAPIFPDVAKAVLDNGLQIRVVSRETAPQIHCQLLFDGGHDCDPVGKEGLTALTLTLLSKTKKTRSVDEFDASLTALGMGVGMAADGGSMSVFMTANAGDLDEAIAHTAEFALQPAYLEDEFAFHHASVVAGQRRTRSPGENSGRALDKLSRGYLREQTLESVGSITLADVVTRYRAWMDPAKTVLFVAGNVGLDQVVAAARSAFADWEKQGPALSAESRDPVSSPGYYLVAGQGEEQTTLTLRCIDERLRTADEVEAATVFAQCLQHRLSEKLRGPGWTYGVGCTAHMHPQLGFFQIGTSVQADRSRDALELIEKELRAVATTRPFTQEEYDRVQSARVFGLVNNWTTCQSVVGTLALDHILGRPEGYGAALEARVRAVTLEAVNDVAGWFADTGRFVTVAFGDPKWLPPETFKLVTGADL